MYRQALFAKYKIRDCFVKIIRKSGIDAKEQSQSGVLSCIAEKSVHHRQRAKSVFMERTCHQNGAKFTMDDLHVEFINKFNSPNHGLKVMNELQNSYPKQPTQCENIFMEFQAKLAAKKAKAVPKPPKPPTNQKQLSWNELKALTVKKYPTVECGVVPKPKKPSMAPVFFQSFHFINQAVKQDMMYVT